MDRPSVYGQPENPVVPQRRLPVSSAVTVVSALLLGLAGVFSFRERNKAKTKPPESASVRPDTDANN